VLGLSERLREDGIETLLDQYVNGAPDQGWPRWMMDQVDRADYVLVVCTETYYRRFRGHEAPGKGRGVDWEGALITNELYAARSRSLKFLPVFLSTPDEAFVPEPLRATTYHALTSEDAYQALYRFLLGKAGVVPGPVGPLQPIADTKGSPLTFSSSTASAGRCVRQIPFQDGSRYPKSTHGAPIIAGPSLASPHIRSQAAKLSKSTESPKRASQCEALLAQKWADIFSAHAPTVSIEEMGLLLERIHKSTKYTRLPSAVGTDQPLTMDAVYVELAVCSRSPQSNPRLLGQALTLVEALNRRRQSRQARRTSVEALLANPRERYLLLLGDPGSGKSSLLRRIVLDVSTGRHSQWYFPLLASLSSWSAACERAECVLPLAEFALASLRYDLGTVRDTPAHQCSGASREILTNTISALSKATSRDGVLFLFDGLDEIAGRGNFYSEACQALSGLGIAFGVVVTSRPVGPIGELNEDATYELMELERDGSEDLVRNWFSCQFAESEASARASLLLSQMDANPRLADMGRNPFLLTLLCQLQAREDGPGLPLLRSEIYARVLELARTQVRLRTGRDQCFSSDIEDRLARFCAWLYMDAPRHPRNLFTDGDWEIFDAPSPSLREHLLSSRLLTCWDEHSGYHLVHLTLHEYLVACALLQTPERAFAHRFDPLFRMVFRFWGAMLWSHGRRETFLELVRELVDHPDILGCTLIDAAWILFDSGISDTKDLLGADLRSRLWSLWERDTPFISSAAAEALGVLDGKWVLERVSATLPSLGEDDVEPLMRHLDLLAEARTPEGEGFLLDLALGVSDKLALPAVSALAIRGGRQVRRRVREGATNATTMIRFAELACRSVHPDSLPKLHEALGRYGEAVDISVLSAIASIADEGSVEPLISWWCVAKAERALSTAEALSAILPQVSSPTLVERLREWFRVVTEIPSISEDERNACVFFRVRGGFTDPVEVIALLKDHQSIDRLLEELQNAGMEGIPFDEPILRAVADLCDGRFASQAFSALCSLESARFLRNLPGVCVPVIRAGLRSVEAKRRAEAASALGTLTDEASATSLLERFIDDGEDMAVRVNAGEALYDLAGTRASVDAVETLMSSGKEDLIGIAGDLLCKWDFGRAGRYRADPHMHAAIARHSSKHALLVFDDCWYDGQGRRHQWD